MKKVKKFCCDCPDAKFHGTGSIIWVSCRFAAGWRDINSECVVEGR